MHSFLIKTKLSATSGKTQFTQRLTLVVKSASINEAKEKFEKYINSLGYKDIVTHEYNAQICADVQFITATNYA